MLRLSWPEHANTSPPHRLPRAVRGQLLHHLGRRVRKGGRARLLCFPQDALSSLPSPQMGLTMGGDFVPAIPIATSVQD